MLAASVHHILRNRGKRIAQMINTPLAAVTTRNVVTAAVALAVAAITPMGKGRTRTTRRERRDIQAKIFYNAATSRIPGVVVVMKIYLEEPPFSFAVILVQ